MILNIKLDMSNAAFEDKGEASRCLRWVADQIDGFTHVLDPTDLIWIKDVNGNTVGKVTVTKEES